MTALDLLLDGLAVYRLTRLIVADGITEPIRARIIGRSGLDGWWTQLIECRWCVSIWVSIGVTTARWCAPTQWGLVAYMLAIACAAPLIARLEAD